MIDGAIKVGSMIELRPELETKSEEKSNRFTWLKRKNLYFGLKYKVKKIHLVHFVSGRNYFLVELDNGVVESIGWFQLAKK